MSSFNSDANIESVLLQSLMGRLQLRPPFLNTNSFLSQNIEDFLLHTNSLHEEDDEDDGEDGEGKTLLSKEESKLEKDIIRIILTGNIESLKPNSGQAVSIGEHHVCVGFHEETDSNYRVWEWHGHIMLFDEENGYAPEYIYGNYFERLQVKVPTNEDKHEEEKEEKGGNLGLKELIEGGDSISGRILHRNLNAGSPRF